MAFSQDYLDFLLDQFSHFGEINHKKMFGGVGFYKNGIMFGGIMGGNLHLKVDDLTRPEFTAHGMQAFHHGKKGKGMPTYYQVPAEIVEDRDALSVWAEKAYQAAVRSKK